jgi:hypothetical protein
MASATHSKLSQLIPGVHVGGKPVGPFISTRVVMPAAIVSCQLGANFTQPICVHADNFMHVLLLA